MLVPVPKFLSTGHWPESKTVHRDDTYMTNPQMFVGREIVITEKLDGGNTCLARGEVYARSTGLPSHDGWFAMVRKHHGWKTVNDAPDLYTYGEDLYGIHSIEYAAMKEQETYHVFAVRQQDTFLSWDDVELRAMELDCPTTPVRFRGVVSSIREITAIFESIVAGPSSIGGPCEGGCIRVASDFPADQFSSMTAKYVRPKHVQTDEHWTRNWQPAKLVR